MVAIVVGQHDAPDLFERVVRILQVLRKLIKGLRESNINQKEATGRFDSRGVENSFLLASADPLGNCENPSVSGSICTPYRPRRVSI